MIKMYKYTEMVEVETETWDDSSQILEVKKRNGINARIQRVTRQLEKATVLNNISDNKQ